MGAFRHSSLRALAPASLVVFAIVLLIVGKEVVLPSLLHGPLNAGTDVKALGFTLNALILVGVGLALGAAGSGLTIRRFLRV